MQSEREYLNHNLTITERDEFAFRMIPDKKWRDQERYCRNHCWFDYRFLHPFDATMVYVAAFNTVYREFYRSNRDYRAAEHLRIVEPDDMINNVEHYRKAIIGCWRGRMLADQFGMPYDSYIRDAMDIRLSYWKQRYLPQPMLLYGPMIVEKMEERWIRRQKTRMHFSSHPNYSTEWYIGTAAQNDHHEWLFEQVKFRSNPEEQLKELARKGLLPVEKIKARYGDSLTLH